MLCSPVRHRLQAGVREVDDRQPQVPEADALVGEDAAPVGAPVSELVEPAFYRRALRRLCELDDAREAAH